MHMYTLTHMQVKEHVQLLIVTLTTSKEGGSGQLTPVITTLVSPWPFWTSSEIDNLDQSWCQSDGTNRVPESWHVSHHQVV